MTHQPNTTTEENFDFRKATLGVLMQHESNIVVFQEDEQIYNFCVTFLAYKLGVNAFELDKAIQIVSNNLKELSSNNKKEGVSDEKAE